MRRSLQDNLLVNLTQIHRYGTRTGRMDQGMGEIAGFHLDRALGLNRKPPVVGRMVSSKILFRDTDVGGDQSYDPDKDPEWFIPVAMVAYMDSLKLYVPPKYVHSGRVEIRFDSQEGASHIRLLLIYLLFI